MKKILIIGGCGYIGSMVVNHLKHKYNITIVTRTSYSHAIFDNIKIIKINMKRLKKKFINKFDIIIWLAGQTSTKSSGNIFSSMENNFENILNLFKFINTDQILIYSSSSCIYGNKENAKETDDNHYKFYDFYDFSKKMLDMFSEIIIKKNNKKIFGLRFGTVSGFSPNFRNDSMINSMTHSSIKHKKCNVFAKETKRPILGMSDLCRSIETIIQHGSQSNCGFYNLASFNSTVNIIGQRIAELTNAECVTLKNATHKSSYNFSINCDKFTNTFNFEFHDTMETIVRDIQKNYNNIIINNNRNKDKYLDYVFPYKKINECRVCNNKNLQSVLDLGYQPLANDFHENITECQLYPLNLMICNTCYHLQLEHVVNSNILYKNYIYESGTSKTGKKYFENIFSKIDQFIGRKETKTVLEIACNDGTQLNYFKEGGWITIGVDPAKNLAEISSANHDIYCDFFNEKIATNIKKKYKNIDIILCQNVFAHTHNINEFISACKICMNEKTKLYIQVSQANLVRDVQYDTVYHEHLSFFNINSMKYIIDKFGLFINNIEKPHIHGVSYLFEIGKIKNKQSNVHEMLEEEVSIGLNKIETYRNYSKECKRKSLVLKLTILQHILDGYTIIGYGASAKGNTILNYIKINNNEIKYIVDDQVTKQGLYTPGSNIPICSKEKLASFDKVAILMITWNFKNEIMEKVKGVRGNLDTTYIFY